MTTTMALTKKFDWNLEQFGIKRPEKLQVFTEETEDIEEPEETERHRSHKVGSGCLERGKSNGIVRSHRTGHRTEHRTA